MWTNKYYVWEIALWIILDFFFFLLFFIFQIFYNNMLQTNAIKILL